MRLSSNCRLERQCQKMTSDEFDGRVTGVTSDEATTREQRERREGLTHAQNTMQCPCSSMNAEQKEASSTSSMRSRATVDRAPERRWAAGLGTLRYVSTYCVYSMERKNWHDRGDSREPCARSCGGWAM